MNSFYIGNENIRKCSGPVVNFKDCNLVFDEIIGRPPDRTVHKRGENEVIMQRSGVFLSQSQASVATICTHHRVIFGSKFVQEFVNKNRTCLYPEHSKSSNQQFKSTLNRKVSFEESKILWETFYLFVPYSLTICQTCKQHKVDEKVIAKPNQNQTCTLIWQMI